MPMSIATIGRERTLRSLARNLFAIERGDREAERRAEAALLRANPALAERDAFKKGAAVLVPADLGLPTTARVDQPEQSVAGSLKQAEALLRVTASIAEENLAASAHSAEAMLKRLQSESVRKSIARDAPHASKLVAAAEAGAAERMETAKSQRAVLEKTFAIALEEIANLRRLADD